MVVRGTTGNNGGTTGTKKHLIGAVFVAGVEQEIFSQGFAITKEPIREFFFLIGLIVPLLL